MTNIVKGLVWATSMIVLALATNAGLVSREVAEPMLLVLPVLAVVSIGQTSCRRPQPGQRA